MSQDRVMLLIDADNVSVDVMEQAVRLLLNQHGGLHVRRAYCTAESAVSNQAVFKRLGIKPMVNLAAGKNSTDIALAVDAIDLVLAERPDVVVIASSDSDFAPLVHRLREKGCVVRGIGQKGKTADETQDVYDDFTVLEHHKTGSAAVVAAKPARKSARKTAHPAPAADEPVLPKKAPAARKTTPRATARAASSPEPVAEPTLEEPKPVARKSTARRAAGSVDKGSVRGEARGAKEVAAVAVATPAGTSVQAVLSCLPELASGKSLALNVAVQRLRESHLLGKNSSSLKLFAQLSDQFELLPANKPTQVRLRG